MHGLLLLKSRPGLSQQSLVVRVLVMSKEGGCAEGGWPGSLLIATEAANVACVMDKWRCCRAREAGTWASGVMVETQSACSFRYALTALFFYTRILLSTVVQSRFFLAAKEKAGQTSSCFLCQIGYPFKNNQWKEELHRERELAWNMGVFVTENIMQQVPRTCPVL